MKKIQKLFLSFAALLILSLTVPSTVPAIGSLTEVSAAVKISKTSLVLLKGQSKTLKVTGTKKKPKWSSSKKSVATVSSSGKITAKQKGTATITAKIGKKAYRCKVTVQAPALNKKSISLIQGKTYTLKLSGTNQKITWKSSNKNIATVSSKGKVTAKRKGSCNVYATVLGKKYTCKITVKAKPAPLPKDTYGIGNTWKVPGQWELKITSVKKSSYRNPYWDKNPAVVYYINYTYKNLGFKDKYGYLNGLFLSLDMGSIVDSHGAMGESYPGDITNYPQPVPVGAYCTAQVCVGLAHDGNFKIYFNQYDGNSVNRKATFAVNVH